MHLTDNAGFNVLSDKHPHPQILNFSYSPQLPKIFTSPIGRDPGPIKKNCYGLCFLRARRTVHTPLSTAVGKSVLGGINSSLLSLV